jgi:hypothetical protein
MWQEKVVIEVNVCDPLPSVNNAIVYFWQKFLHVALLNMLDSSK